MCTCFPKANPLLSSHYTFMTLTSFGCIFSHVLGSFFWARSFLGESWAKPLWILSLVTGMILLLRHFQKVSTEKLDENFYKLIENY